MAIHMTIRTLEAVVAAAKEMEGKPYGGRTILTKGHTIASREVLTVASLDEVKDAIDRGFKEVASITVSSRVHIALKASDA